MSGLSREALSQSDFTEIQTFIDSNITRNFIYTNLTNDILSASLNSKLNFVNSYKNVKYFLKNYYSSDVTKLSQNLFRDFDNVKTGVGYSLNENVDTYLKYTGMFFSDDKNIQIKGTSSNLLALSGEYQGTVNGVNITSTADAGYKFEKQIGELNRGLSFAGQMDFDNLNMSDYFVNGQLKLGYEHLTPRKNSTIFSRLNIDKSFSDNLAHNELDATYSRLRKDFYFPADPITISEFGAENNIEQRIESIMKAYDRFDYTVSNSIGLYLTFNPYYRDITKVNYYVPVSTTAAPSIYDTEIQELSIDGEAAMNIDLKKLTTQIKMYYMERDEKHFVLNPSRLQSNFVSQTEDLETSKNNHSSLFKLSGDFFYNVSRSNRFELLGSSSIFRYDTPRNLTFDDRDELNILFYLSHRYDNFNNFQIINSVDLNLYHTVYLLSEKSANNNWNRVLRLTSKNIFTPMKNFKTINTFIVLANYTVYDYEDLVSDVKSYSFRQFNVKDSTTWKFSGDFGVDVYAELKLYERGELNWREFSERPVNYFDDRIINAQLDYFFNKFITFSGGYRYFEQRMFNYINGDKIFSTAVKTYGPMLRLRADIQKYSYIDLVASFDTYNYGTTLSSTSNGSLYLTVQWNF